MPVLVRALAIIRLDYATSNALRPIIAEHCHADRVLDNQDRPPRHFAGNGFNFLRQVSYLFTMPSLPPLRSPPCRHLQPFRLSPTMTLGLCSPTLKRIGQMR